MEYQIENLHYTLNFISLRKSKDYVYGIWV